MVSEERIDLILSDLKQKPQGTRIVEGQEVEGKLHITRLERDFAREGKSKTRQRGERVTP